MVTLLQIKISRFQKFQIFQNIQIPSILRVKNIKIAQTKKLCRPLIPEFTLSILYFSTLNGSKFPLYTGSIAKNDTHFCGQKRSMAPSWRSRKMADIFVQWHIAPFIGTIIQPNQNSICTYNFISLVPTVTSQAIFSINRAR